MLSEYRLEAKLTVYVPVFVYMLHLSCVQEKQYVAKNSELVTHQNKLKQKEMNNLYGPYWG